MRPPVAVNRNDRAGYAACFPPGDHDPSVLTFLTVV